jgi:hypothetical protein
VKRRGRLTAFGQRICVERSLASPRHRRPASQLGFAVLAETTSAPIPEEQVDSRWSSRRPRPTLRDDTGRARKSHVIPANAGIQEATSLVESHPFGSDEGPNAAALWPLDTRFRGYQIHTSRHVGRIGWSRGHAANHPGPSPGLSPQRGRGEGTASRGSVTPEMPSRSLPRRHVGPRTLSPPRCGERFVRGLGDWPHGFKQTAAESRPC